MHSLFLSVLLTLHPGGMNPHIEYGAMAHRAERCPQFTSLLIEYAPPGGWDVDWMSHRMWVESRCRPTATNGSHTGLLQIAHSWNRKLTAALGEKVTKRSLTDAELNVRAAAQLCAWQRERHRNCYQPWSRRKKDEVES